MSEANLNELYHHGILGMKWGKKNGPPYPLDYKKLSAEERAAAKDKAIRQGNIKEAASNIDYYDNNELRAVKERFSLNQDIAKLNASTIKTGKQKAADIVESFSRGLKRATDAGEAGIKAYNFMAKAMNSFSDEDSQLPLIGEKKPHRNKAEGKTKGQMAEMLRKGNLSTKDYEDIKNRLNAMNEAESGIRKQRSYSKEDIEDIFDNPTRYSKESLKEAADAAVNFNKIANTTWYKERENVREERRESEREEKDYWGFYHSAEFQDELMHRRKGQENKKHKYTKKEKLDSGKYRYYYETGRNYTQMANDLSNLVKDETNQFIDLTKQQKENYDNSVVDRQVTVKRFPFKDKQVNRKVKVSKSQAQKEAATKVANARTQHKKTVQKSYSDMESQKRMAASAYNKHQQTSKSYKVKASMATKINKAKAWLRKKNIQKTYAVDAYGWRNRKTNEYANLGAGFIKKYLSVSHSYEDELYHHGVLGMKWGVRRYQNPDGTLTDAGIKRYRSMSSSSKPTNLATGKGVQNRLNDVDQATTMHIRNKKKSARKVSKLEEKIRQREYELKRSKSDQSSDKKMTKLKEKVRKENEKIKSSSKMIDKGHEETWKLLARASEMGYDTNVKYTVRYAHKGKLYTIHTLGGLIASVPYTLLVDQPEIGYKYKLSKTKNTNNVGNITMPKRYNAYAH